MSKYRESEQKKIERIRRIKESMDLNIFLKYYDIMLLFTNNY